MKRMGRRRKGKLIIYIGSPFSGKSTKLVKIANSLMNFSHLIFAPYPMVSRKVPVRNLSKIRCTTTLPKDLPKVSTIFIDELQLMKNIPMVYRYINKGINVYATAVSCPKVASILASADKVINVKDTGKSIKITDSPYYILTSDLLAFQDKLKVAIELYPNNLITYYDKNGSAILDKLKTSIGKSLALDSNSMDILLNSTPLEYTKNNKYKSVNVILGNSSIKTSELDLIRKWVYSGKSVKIYAKSNTVANKLTDYLSKIN